MKIKKMPFGKIDEHLIDQYILENDRGASVRIMNYGATITSIELPDKEGNICSVACGFDNLKDYFTEEYIANAPYFGSTVGRYCSQIKDAKFELQGKTYQLAKNCGPNNLHGGVTGFDKKIWQAEETEAGLVMTLHSKDMEEGFPGNVDAKVIFDLSDDNALSIKYYATTDKTTPLSMTNHTYFNLSGFERKVEDVTVTVKTNRLLALDETGAAIGVVRDVTGTIEDLRDGRKVKEVHDALGDGFEHFYVFDNPERKINMIAQVTDNESGRQLEVYSSEPCMLFYTGKYTSDALRRNENENYGKYRGFCCETHRWPNGPNINQAPGTTTTPAHPFQSETIFKFII